MEVFLERCLTRILEESSRRQTELRKAASDALERLRTQQQEGTSQSSSGEDADNYFRPLQLACETESAKTKVIALDTMQKLIAYGYLRGNLRVIQNNVQRYLIDIVIETICSCRDDPYDNVQLQVIKALLTAVSSNTCQVREHSLILAVRSCYHIFLVSRNPVNRTTAKATLTQMLDIVFQRMETYDQRLQQGLPPPEHMRIAPDLPTELVGRKDHQSGAGEGGRTDQESPFGEYMYPAVAGMLGFRMAPAAAASSPGRSIPMGGPAAEEDTTMGPPQFGIGFDPENRALTELEDGTESLGPFPSPYHKDAYLLFRALCRLSMAEDDAGEARAAYSSGRGAGASATVGSDAVPVASKILSLDLILSVLQHAGQTFRTTPRFVFAIRHHLADSLLKNFVSPHPQVVSLSLRIFLVLVESFREHLNEEIEVFISSIFLAILNSSHTSFEQKLAVLEVVGVLCKDARVIVELFLNFDCAEEDSGRERLFEKVMDTLGAIAQGRASDTFYATQKTNAERVALRREALKALAAIMTSIDSTVSQCVVPRLASQRVDGWFQEGPAGELDEVLAAVRTRESSFGDEREADTGEGDAGAMPSSPANSDAGAIEENTPSVGRRSLAATHDRSKRRREEIQRAALRFRMKPKDGIKYLQEIGRCGHKPADVAQLFHELKDVLDKTAIGDYMGEDKDFNLGVLHAYVEDMDFSGLKFDEAVRHFLKGFRLPGEAQKIDRMMEKFAEVYCQQNPTVFPTADTAFILAYSIIMLNTDAHNPSIPPDKKMKQQDFVRNNRGIANGDNLPDKLLEQIYDSIVDQPITLKEDDALRAREEAKHVSSNSSKARLAMQQSERARLLQSGVDRIRARRERARRKRHVGARMSGGSAVFEGTMDSITESDEPAMGEEAAAATGGGGSPEEDSEVSGYVQWDEEAVYEALRPMFEVAWPRLMASFSINLEQGDEKMVVDTCLAGFREAIRTAGILGMETEREALVSALVRFTLLDTIGVELRPKNVHCCCEVLRLASEEGEWLGSSWRTVHSCLSEIARLHNEAMGVLDDGAFFPETDWDMHQGRRADDEHHGHGMSGFFRLASRVPKGLQRRGPGGRLQSRTDLTPQEITQVMHRNARSIAAAIPESALERVYTGSVNLSADAIVDFVTALLRVSVAEVQLVEADVGIEEPHGRPGHAERHSPGSLDDTDARSTVSSLTVLTRGSTARHPSAQNAWGGWVGASLQAGTPRVYSLQKLVDVAEYNLDSRGRMTWSRVWSPLSRFFTAVGCHANTTLARYAIDRLKQLAGKFLMKPELGSFHFQRIFLAPFAAIMEAQPKAAIEVRELILDVIAHLILSRAMYFRSGWQTVFVVHAAAARDSSAILVSLAFDTVNSVLNEHFDRVVRFGSFVEAIHCALAFATNSTADLLLSVRSVDHVVSAGVRLARGDVPIGDGNDEYVLRFLHQYRRALKKQESPDADEDERAGDDGDAEETKAWREDEDGGVVDGIPVPDREIWYDLDGPENADVRASVEQAERCFQHALRGSVVPSDGAASAGPEDHEFMDNMSTSGMSAADARWEEVDSHPGGEGGDADSLLRESSGGGLVRRFTDSRPHTGAWWPVLTALMRVIGDSREPVRTRALDGLFAVLYRFGPAFSSDLWMLIFSGILMPLFDDVRHAHVSSLDGGGGNGGGGRSGHRLSNGRRPSHGSAGGGAAVISNKGGLEPVAPVEQWLRTTALPALSSLVKLMARFFPRLTFLVPQLMNLLESCVDQEVEGLARIGVRCLRLLLVGAGPRFDTAQWEVVVNSFTRMCRSTMPTALLEARQVLLPRHVDAREVGGEDETDMVATPYGRGRVVSRPSPGKIEVELAWGARMFTTTTTPEATAQAPVAHVAHEPRHSRPEAVPESALPFNSIRVVTQCVVQLELVGSIRELTRSHLGALTVSQLRCVLQLLEESAEVAREFNGDQALREALWHAGFMRFVRQNKLPSLLRQEAGATRQLLQLLLHVVHPSTESRGADVVADGSAVSQPAELPPEEAAERHALALSRLRHVARAVVARYETLDEEVQRVRGAAAAAAATASSTSKARRAARETIGATERELYREYSAYGPLVECFLQGILDWDSETFRKELAWTYPILTRLILSGNHSVRNLLTSVFTTRVQPVLPLPEANGAVQEAAAGAGAAV